MTATEVFDTNELKELLGSLPVDPLRLLHATLDLVGETNLAELMDVQLAANVVRLRRRMDRADAIFAAWTLASHQRGVCTVDGYKSTASWLGWKTGMHRGQVRRVIRTGEVAELLPETGAAWRHGKISTAAVEAITSARVPGHDDKLRAVEAEFLDLARRGDHASLRRAAAYFADHARADGLRLSKVLDGRSNISGELSGLAAETITTALNAFMDPPPEGDGRTDAQRRADALVRICEIALEQGACGVRAGANVTVVVDWTTLTNGDFGRMDGQFTGPIPRPEIERRLCDCKVSRVVMGPDSKPLDVGRTTRVWSPAQRNAIVARDAHCRWPGCKIPAPWSEIHHHQHWEHGGETSITNGYLLCSHHHHFLHRQPDWTTTFDDQVLHVYRPDRRELHPNPSRN